MPEGPYIGGRTIRRQNCFNESRTPRPTQCAVIKPYILLGCCINIPTVGNVKYKASRARLRDMTAAQVNGVKFLSPVDAFIPDALTEKMINDCLSDVYSSCRTTLQIVMKSLRELGGHGKTEGLR